MTINEFSAKMTRNSNDSNLLKALRKLASIENSVNVLKFQNNDWLPWSVEMVGLESTPCGATS